MKNSKLKENNLKVKQKTNSLGNFYLNSSSILGLTEITGFSTLFYLTWCLINSKDKSV